MDHLYLLDKVQQLWTIYFYLAETKSFFFFFKSLFIIFPTHPQALKLITETHNFKDTILSSLPSQNAWHAWLIGRRPLRQELSEEYSSDNVEGHIPQGAVHVGPNVLGELESPSRDEKRGLTWSALEFRATSGYRVRMSV